MEKVIKVSCSTVEDAVKKHLSIMGKRLKDKDETLMYSKITLSDNEADIMHQYINAAAEVFVSEMTELVTYYGSEDFLVFKITNSRWGASDGVCIPFEGNFMGYTVAYVANAILGMNYPELAKKYAVDMTNHLAAAIKLVYTKQPPATGEIDYEEISAIKKIEDSETKTGY